MQGAIQAFKQAIKQAHGSEFEKIYTDSLGAYRKGVTRSFEWGNLPELIAKCGIVKPHMVLNGQTPSEASE